MQDMMPIEEENLQPFELVETPKLMHKKRPLIMSQYQRKSLSDNDLLGEGANFKDVEAAKRLHNLDKEFF